MEFYVNEMFPIQFTWISRPLDIKKAEGHLCQTSSLRSFFITKENKINENTSTIHIAVYILRIYISFKY